MELRATTHSWMELISNIEIVKNGMLEQQGGKRDGKQFRKYRYVTVPFMRGGE